MKNVLISLAALLCSTILFSLWLVATSPNPKPVSQCMVTKMNGVRLCPGSRAYTPITGISRDLVNAVLISEDASFFLHSGFDWEEIRVSLGQNLIYGKLFRGGSTITQQLVKNLFLTKEKTLARKVREAFLTLQIESILNKHQILERYLNVVEFGPRVFGVKEAAQKYFRKNPEKLNVLEAAYLAHLLPNPRLYSTTFRTGVLTDFSKERILNICKKMFLYKRISAPQMAAAEKYISYFPWHSLQVPALRPRPMSL